MSADPVVDLARRINEADGPKGVLYLSGGGTEVLPILLARGGGSATLLAARVPYAPEDFRATLGYDPGRIVAPRAARGMAMAAFRHALAIRGDLPPEKIFGLGSTSKLSTGADEREGREHEIHVAVQSTEFTGSWGFTLPKGQDRAWQERINALIVLNLLASLKVGSGYLPLRHNGRDLPPSDLKFFKGNHGEPSMADLLVGRLRWVALDAPPKVVLDAHVVWEFEDLGTPGFRTISPRSTSGEHAVWTSEDQGPPRLLLPGSFRPLHGGHVAMAEVASRLSGLPCAFEFSLTHPEKPPLDFLAIRSRLKDFWSCGRTSRIYLTNAPTYLEKARLFPDCTFVVGHDTALRIVDPRFYGGTPGRDAMLDELERLGARFLIFGRVDSSGEFHDFSSESFEGPVAGFLTRIARPVPAHVFRLDISSTELREISGDEYE